MGTRGNMPFIGTRDKFGGIVCERPKKIGDDIRFGKGLVELSECLKRGGKGRGQGRWWRAETKMSVQPARSVYSGKHVRWWDAEA